MSRLCENRASRRLAEPRPQAGVDRGTEQQPCRERGQPAGFGRPAQQPQFALEPQRRRPAGELAQHHPGDRATFRAKIDVVEWLGNEAYGEVDSPAWTSLNGSRKGANCYPGYSGLAFEPIDEERARAQLAQERARRAQEEAQRAAERADRLAEQLRRLGVEPES